MPNAFATLMLMLWPIVIWRLFVALPPGRALIWSLLGAYLLLPPPPAVFDFPLMPALDKTSLTNLAIVVVAFLVLPQRPKLLPENKIARLLLAVFVLSPVATVMGNGEPLVFTQSYIRGLYLQDAVAQPINNLILVLGFLLARALLQTPDDQRDVLVALVVAALAYSVPILLEVRLSPQLNNWVYGYFQHLFSQTIRGGGYRPMVFLYHGIWLAYFVLTALLAALTVWKAANGRSASKFLIAALYLAIVLVLCKTLATLVYASLAAGAILMLRQRTQVRLAIGLAAILLAYPVLKSADVVPSDAIIAQAETLSAERAQSLSFRIVNEDILFERAMAKPLFGWGIWGRNHIHDSTTGEITTVSDGYWIIVIGVWGWVGYIAQFGLIALPIWLIFREMRHVEPTSPASGARRQRAMPHQNEALSPFVGPLAVMLGFNMIDLLPNATLTPITWLIAGTLFGYAERLAQQRRHPEHQTATHTSPATETEADAPRTIL